MEDNFIIAMDMEELVTELGAATVHLTSNCDEALDVIDEVPVSAAILDFNVEGGTSERVADALVRKRVPFIFTTGESDADAFPARYQSHSILNKPYLHDDIIAMFMIERSDFVRA